MDIKNKTMATFSKANGKTIKEAFKEFHEKNPQVYELFKELVVMAIARGKKKISSKTILGGIRWEYYMRTEDETGFKINDAYTAHYARLFVSDYPYTERYFEFRELRS